MNEMSMNQELFQFIEKSPCAYLAAATTKDTLLEQGFQELSETECWNLQPGGKYVVSRNDSAVIAFQIPNQADQEHMTLMSYIPTIQGFHISAAHLDSPSFKIKESPEMKTECYVKLNVEKYGGMILSTWLDRSLSIAGRVVVWNGEELVSHMVNFDRDMLVIPNLAIHMNAELNKGYEYNIQTDMTPLFAQGGTLYDLLTQVLRVSKEEILGTDLYLYNRDKGTMLGGNQEFIGAPRLDDLQCAFAALKGFLKAADSGAYCNVLALFDNEEVGSGTKQGADSTFLSDILVRIKDAFHITESAYLQMLAESFMLSADNAHGLHPNHPEKACPTNRPVLNGGIVIKYQGSQRYATDGYSGAFVKQLCKKINIPYQTYANKSDIPGGSTLGNIATTHVPVKTADIGLAQLAMHSAFETAGAKDTEYMAQLMEAFYSL